MFISSLRPNIIGLTKYSNGNFLQEIIINVDNPNIALNTGISRTILLSGIIYVGELIPNSSVYKRIVQMGVNDFSIYENFDGSRFIRYEMKGIQRTGSERINQTYDGNVYDIFYLPNGWLEAQKSDMSESQNIPPKTLLTKEYVEANYYSKAEIDAKFAALQV
jgi:hypothetical protein